MATLKAMSSAGKSRRDVPASATPKGERTKRAVRYGAATPASAAKPAGGRSGDIAGKALAAVMVAIVAAAIFYAFQYFNEQKKVNAEISYVSHEVIDDSTLRVWADVTRNRPDEPAYCIVQAYDYSKAEVGRREFAVAADGKESIRLSVDIPTNARAVAGGVYGCSSQIPPYLDIDNPIYD